MIFADLSNAVKNLWVKISFHKHFKNEVYKYVSERGIFIVLKHIYKKLNKQSYYFTNSAFLFRPSGYPIKPRPSFRSFKRHPFAFLKILDRNALRGN